MPGDEPRYSADPAEAAGSMALEGLTLLFHRPSGVTHILAPPAPQILETLGRDAITSAELATRLAERFELVGGDDVLIARLEELVAAGLVERR